IKARLTRPGKPLASFLFIGPTGVGKTELAKTLAEFFYGAKDRLIRLDMSEYSTPGSAGRLAAGGRNEEEGILTAQMRDQPFSVLLLDEFEKADSTVYDLFLQVLGEARLTDGAGRLADFSNAIIILTSNLGAREFRTSRPGFFDPETDVATVATDHFTGAVKKNFRPEFFNRIDRIVPFLPLNREAVRAVVKREVGLAEYRDGLRNRNLSLIVPDEFIGVLADEGYDPRYGARPLKGTIEARLLAPVSEFLCSQGERECENGFLEMIGEGEEGLEFQFRAATDGSEGGGSLRGEWGVSTSGVRRKFQQLAASSLMSELQSARKRVWSRKERKDAKPEDHQRLHDLEELIQSIENQQERILKAEERLLLAGFREEPTSAFEAAVEDVPDEAEFTGSLLDAYSSVRNLPAKVVLILKSDSESLLFEQASAYCEVAEELGCSWRAGYWQKHPDEEQVHPDDRTVEGQPGPDNPRSRPVVPAKKSERENLLMQQPEDFGALAIEFSGKHALLFFGREVGLHTFKDPAGEKSSLAIAYFDEGESLENAWLPEDMLLNYDWKHLVVRRNWDHEARRMRDSGLGSSPETDGKKLPWEFSTGALIELIRDAAVMEATRFLQ
ncbi:MAG: ATP-dependent Clp protease ATP-binding subunit, partial [Verrucomicrobiales bacterium]|nr:ATP-dependent Clp protease ATP-binding subunit [Verrucomicrobiales bacterium]